MNPMLRSAYERGRLRDAGRDATPLLAVFTPVLLATEARPVQFALALAAGAAFVLLRWRGLGWGHGAIVGAVAGLLPLLTPFVLVAKGLGCAGPGCESWCATLCASGGLVAGLAIGAASRSATAVAGGALVATLAGVVGCWPMGATTVAGMIGALLAGEALGRGGRILLSSRG